MGFQRPQFKLIFDGDYAGLEVITRGGSIFEVARFAAILSSGDDDGYGILSADRDVERKELIEILGSKLISWTLTDDKDEPVPCTAEQLAQEDVLLILVMARGWMRRGSNVSGPLDQQSSDGIPSAVESTTMEILS